MFQRCLGRERGRTTEPPCPFPQEELEHSLGESAAQGAAGVVLWVSWENTKTKVSSGVGRGAEVGWGDPGPSFLPLQSCRLASEGLSALGGPSMARCP